MLAKLESNALKFARVWVFRLYPNITQFGRIREKSFASILVTFRTIPSAFYSCELL
jgi:hypothetical protein